MNRFNLLGKPSESQTQADEFVALDVGTEMVKVLVCRREEDSIRILGAGQAHQHFDYMSAGSICDIDGVTNTVAEALNQALSVTNVSPKQVITGLSGDLVRSIKSTLRYVRPDPSVGITPNELKNLVHHWQWKAHDAMRAQLAQELNQPDLDVELIHTAVMDLAVDGQPVTNLIGFVGREISLTALANYAPTTQLKALQKVIANLKLTPKAVVSQPYAVAKMMNCKSNFGGIVVDVGGGTTDIAVVQHGIIEGSRGFGIAGRAFTERLSQRLNLNWEDAESAKLAYTNHLLEKESATKVAETFAEDAEVWLMGVKVVLSEFSQLKTLPRHIYLCGGGSRLPEISQVLTMSDWHKGLPFSRKPEVAVLSPTTIRGIIDENGYLRDAQDVTPAALAILWLDNEASSSLNKICQTVS